jgi:two-component system, OmpR family, phosphate regulon sensor histidine kinase PhoR
MKKLRTAQLLMTLSVLVISCFQVYWLLTLFNDKESSIKKNTDIVFRETLYQLQVTRFKNDSLFSGLPGENLFMIDMANVLRKRIDDTTISKGGKKNFFISIDSKVDSQYKGNMQFKDSVRNENIIIKHTEKLPPFLRALKDSSQLYDSIPLIVIDSSYRHALAKANIDLPFKIFKINMSHDTGKCVSAFCTGIVPMGLFGLIGYKASFESPKYFILKSISLQLVLSVLLVALTIASFLFIYRNLVMQQRLSDIKNDFISNITHELKTPIATVNVAIEALRNFGGLYDPERTIEYLDISASELQRLSLLVDKVLKISMFEKKEITLEKERFDLVQLAREVMDSMKLQFEQQNAVTALEISGENFIIEADKLHMTSVIYNLLDNALKYSKENPHIIVYIFDRSQYIELRVSDNGIGIANEYKSKIFEQFFRVPGGDKHNIKGYGLGLSYVNHIIKRHHGFIEVESELDKGSTFAVKVPFKEAPVIYYDNNRRVRRVRIKLWG